MRNTVKLWLDDVRPAPLGWTWCKTVAAAQALLMTGSVEEASLDHDLGMDAIIDQLSPEGRASLMSLNGAGWAMSEEDDGILLLHARKLMRIRAISAELTTGYDLVRWMEDTGHWPRQKPKVHSANPAGAHAMRAVINQHYGDG